MLKGLAAIVAALVLAPAALGQEASEGWGYQITHDLMSPYCPGRTLADCPSPQADSLRMWILFQEASGRTRADVEAELVERYGDVVLSAPRATGFGLAAYFVPVLAFAAGGLFVWVYLRRQTRAPASAAAPAAPARASPDPELERLVDEELAQ